MSRTIFCVFLKKKSEGHQYPPYPGKIGEKIYNKISKIAWKKWMIEQTKIINENKLNMLQEEDRKKIEHHMNIFLFHNQKNI